MHFVIKMAAAQQVANAFTVDFVERVSKNAANLAEVYGRRATLTINDFELGISEVSDSDVPLAAQKWAASLQGSRLRVDSVNAAPIYGGVNVFLTLTALGDQLQQYFHVATTLESYQDTFGMDGFYVRHQVIARIGAVVPEPPAQPEPTPVVEEKPAKQTPAPEAPVAEAAPAKAKTPTPEPQPEAAPEPVAEAVAAPAEPEAQEAPAEEEKKAAAPAAAAPSSGKPKSWAAMLSHAPVKSAEPHRPVKVVARDSAAEKKEAAAAKKEAAAPKEAPAKRPAPRERKAPEPVGDRLMFNITGAVTDEEIRAALGAMAAHLVSLRNNSAKGHVFMDFAENVAVFDELTKAQPVIGAAKLKMSVFRQRPRD